MLVLPITGTVNNPFSFSACFLYLEGRKNSLIIQSVFFQMCKWYIKLLLFTILIDIGISNEDFYSDKVENHLFAYHLEVTATDVNVFLSSAF